MLYAIEVAALLAVPGAAGLRCVRTPHCRTLAERSTASRASATTASSVPTDRAAQR